MKPIAVPNLHGHVVHDMGQRIVSGGLRSGEVPPREELLADRMEVSHSVLREALKVLSATWSPCNISSLC